MIDNRTFEIALHANQAWAQLLFITETTDMVNKSPHYSIWMPKGITNPKDEHETSHSLHEFQDVNKYGGGCIRPSLCV
jgi:hypothetical protein